MYIHLKVKRRNFGILYVLPVVVFAVIFTFIPLSITFFSSLFTTNYSSDIAFRGLENYKYLLTDPYFLKSISNTLFFALLFVPLNTVLTLAAAALCREKSKLTFIFEFIFSSPIVISLASYALIFKQMFSGRVNIINRIISSDIPWLENRASAMFVLALLGVFLDFGINYLLLLFAFRNIDQNIKSAAMLDGSGKFSLFFKIELPLIKPILLVTVFMAVKDSLLISSPVLLLTNGGPFRSTETIMYYYYTEAFRSSNGVIGNTIAVLMIAISALLISLIVKWGKKDA